MSNEEVVKQESAAKEAPKKKKTRSKKKGQTAKQVPHVRAYIQATYNNTIVTITDQNGNALAWASAGNCGFKGPKKATPYAASVVVRKLLEKVESMGIKDVSIFAKGVGQGREGAIRAFNANNINVASIQDTTPIPHNGCRKPRPRRM
ncbi:MAG: 30S ribosomal protein S11 [Patescibacteria group bacterium]